ncbi:3-beta hydroxysteroid dehydrogenase/isomerase family protein [Aspergillus bertholletiae]|uniref:3-beta hydroxysteroid dehydrogenase/isomerase family protein n=1 Tax=Aspergillus bertholletiae TaxID=1226010 RepID=A0A5N7AUJ9_9EURO|nr:3-beta hydroxysteroid dehydrogenase/isomerase family protein [Aspergillus bertholletiae]
MTSHLIFITGATGFIGSATALEALRAGYRLRISVRKEPQVTKLKTVLSEFADKLEFVIIPDITDRDAFSGKLDGVDYILHMASPLPHGIEKDTYFGPAIQGTTTILNEATKVPSIKKAVVTSSIAALLPLTGPPQGGVINENNDWDLSVDENGDFTGPNDAVTAFRLYHASKLLANNATWEFRERRKPPFAIVTLHPSFVYGHNLVQTTASEIKGSTNEMFWNALMTASPATLPNYVNIGDVAKAHIRALDPGVPDGSKYLLAGPSASWKDVSDTLKKYYPNEPFKLSAEAQGKSWPTDTSKAEKELGIEWRSVQQTVRELVDQNLRLRGSQL